MHVLVEDGRYQVVQFSEDDLFQALRSRGSFSMMVCEENPEGQTWRIALTPKMVERYTMNESVPCWFVPALVEVDGQKPLNAWLLVDPAKMEGRLKIAKTRPCSLEYEWGDFQHKPLILLG